MNTVYAETDFGSSTKMFIIEKVACMNALCAVACVEIVGQLCIVRSLLP